MTILERVKSDMKTAMKAKEQRRVLTLRRIISDANNIAMDNKRKDATEDDAMLALTRGVKQREESIATYLDANRKDLAEIEQVELVYFKEYLPAQLSEEEIVTLVEKAIETTGASTKKQMGMVMGKLMPDVKGKADGSLVSRLVSERLNKEVQFELF